MKKLLAFVLVLALCLSLCTGLTACVQKETSSSSSSSADIEAALEYVKTLYRKPAEKTSRDFTRIGAVPVNGKTYEVVWSVDVAEEHVKVVKNADGSVTIDVNETSAEEVPYTLTATIKDGDKVVSFSWKHIVPKVNLDFGAIVDEAYALEQGASMDREVTLTGVINKVDTPYDAGYKNITVTMDVIGVEGKPIQCYRLKGEGAENLKPGDTITVAGTLTNYQGKIQFNAGCQLLSVTSAGEVEAPTDVETIMKEAFELADGGSTKYQATLTGKITKLNTPYNPSYKNVSVTIAIEGYEGKELLCYRIKGEGADSLLIGDTITVKGYIVNYKGSVQFGEGSALLKVEKTGSEVKAPSDPKQIVKEAYELKEDESLPYKATLTGKITKVDEFYNPFYGNITVTIVVEGMTDKPIKCYHLAGKGVEDEEFYIGDTITVTGQITNYKGEVEFAHGCTLDKWVNSGSATASYETLTVKQAYDKGNAMEHDTTTDVKYKVTGIVKDIKHDTYGNMNITDGNGNTIYVFGSYSADGTTMYGDMDKKPVAGDTVTVLGVVGNYNGPQMKNVWILSFESPKMPSNEELGLPATDGAEITIEQAIKAGEKIPHNLYTENKYKVTGVIKEVYKAEYGNMYIMDAEGNTLNIYGTYNADGTVKYKDMEVKPIAGDTVTIYGAIGNYNGPQIKNGWIVDHKVPETQLEVSFDLNYDDAGEAPASFKVNENTAYGNLPTPIREGYKFISWHKDKECTTEAVTSETTVTESHTLFAKWEKVEAIDPDVLAEMQAIVDAAYELEKDASLEGTKTLIGQIVEINEAYDEANSRITVTIAVEGRETMAIKCYRMTGNGIDGIGVGDTITVTGTLTNYNYEIEFKAGCTLDDVVKGTLDVVTSMTDAEIVDAAYAVEKDRFLPGRYTLTGKIVSVDGAYNASYGNITVLMAVEGKEDKDIKCFRLKGEGAGEIAVGDTITVTGIIKNYNGTVEFDQGCILVSYKKPDSQVKVFFNVNCDGAVETPDTIPVNKDGVYGTLPTPTREGYTFGGWFLTKACDGEAVTATTKVTESHTLYAKWIEKAVSTDPVAVKPEVGKAYKLYIHQKTRSEYLYMTGEMKDYYYATTTNPEEAVDVYVEEVSGGYRVYFMKGETKTYLEMVKSGTHNNVIFTTEPTKTLKWNEDIMSFTCDIEDVDFYWGTYGTYNTFSASELTRVTGDNASAFDVSNFVAHFSAAGEGEEGGETPDPDPVMYEVSFDLNGAEGTAPATRQVEAGKAYDTLPTVEREGYTFGGWFKTEACDGEAVTASTEVTQSHTLYAKWVAIPGTKVKVNFDMNCDDAVETPDPLEVEVGSVYDNLPDPEREGYIFYGWYKDAECTGDFVRASDKVTGPHILYAKWKKVIVNCDISFNLNYEGAENNIEKITVEEGAAYGTLPTDPTREGYTFGGWFLTEACDGEAVKATDTVSASHTLYAKWTRNVARVFFNLNYTGAAGGPDFITVNVGEAYGDQLPTDPTREGYAFGGWFKTEACDGEAVKATDTVSASHTLYAKWTANAPVVVAGGSADLNALIINTNSGGDTKYTGSYETANGWKTTNSAILVGGTENSNGKFEVIGPDKTHKAVCLNGKKTQIGKLTSPTLTTGISKLTVKYTMPFGDNKLSVKVIIKDAAGQTYATHDIVKNSPTKLQAYEDVWTLETPLVGNFTIEVVNNCPSNSSDNKDRFAILSLAWEGAAAAGGSGSGSEGGETGGETPDPVMYDVTFDLNGAEGTAPTAIQVEEGKAYGDQLPPAPTREGYTFEGWALEDGTVVNASTPVTKSHTLYAKWTEIEPEPENEIVVGQPYIFGMTQGNKDNKVYYLKGGMDSYYLATTLEADDAIRVYVEETEGGYYFYTLDGETKLYINMVASDGHVNGAYEETASTVYTYDAEHNTLIGVVDGTEYWFATRNDKTFTNMGPCAVSYNGFYGEFYEAAEKEPVTPVVPDHVEPSSVSYAYSSYDSYKNVVKNWGYRGDVATSLSPMASAFYTGTDTYVELAKLSGSSTLSSVPQSTLYTALKTLMVNRHTKQTTYGDTRYLFGFTDCEGTNSDTFSPFYSGGSKANSWDEGKTWNREHCWPKSKTSAANPDNNDAGGDADIMTLRPTLKAVNSGRNNTAYGESSGYYNPNKHTNIYDLRGDVARLVLYTYVRWEESALTGTNGAIESVDVLLKWIEADPVDSWELARNDSVESITGTRNVFVDYPQLAFLLFGEEVPANLTVPSAS